MIDTLIGLAQPTQGPKTQCAHIRPTTYVTRVALSINYALIQNTLGNSTVI